MYDLVIKNGRVLDGLGNEPFFADVGITAGKIAAIGEKLCGKEYIDAGGLTVTPGFIDSHSHSDKTLITYPDQKEKVEQGITYSITGQCGGSAAPYCDKESGKIVTVSEFFSQIANIPQGSGSSMLIGHNTLRRCVMGSENREPTPDELNEMKKLLADGLSAGAIGMSLGLLYVPGSYAKLDELASLAKVVKEHGGIVAAHIRSESDMLIEAAEEFLAVIKESGCRAVFSHHKSCQPKNHGKVKTTLAMIDKANSEGYDIYLDVYPYSASSTSLSSAFVPGFMHPKGTTSVLSLIDDDAFCEKLRAWGFEKWGGDLAFTLITSYKPNPEYEGKNLNEIAAMRGDENPYDTALHMLRESGNKVSACYFTMNEEDVCRVIAHPRSMICTDSSVKGKADKFHPRLTGSFPRAISKYARELSVTTLPEMIRKMTSLPAHVYGLKTKGIIREGMDADLCIFDADKITDTADYVNCTNKNEGIHYVIIDGRVVLTDGVYNGVRAAWAK